MGSPWVASVAVVGGGLGMGLALSLSSVGCRSSSAPHVSEPVVYEMYASSWWEYYRRQTGVYVEAIDSVPLPLMVLLAKPPADSMVVYSDANVLGYGWRRYATDTSVVPRLFLIWETQHPLYGRYRQDADGVITVYRASDVSWLTAYQGSVLQRVHPDTLHYALLATTVYGDTLRLFVIFHRRQPHAARWPFSYPRTYGPCAGSCQRFSAVARSRHVLDLH